MKAVQGSQSRLTLVPRQEKKTARLEWSAKLGIVVLAALAAGLLLRLWMLFAFEAMSGDSLVYGDLAKNLLLHGRFALTDGSGVIHATLIRLPGYPLFIALCFRLFGMEHYHAVAFAQIGVDLVGCLLLADVARRLVNLRVAAIVLWLAVLCPFTADYSSEPLTETLTLAMIALALWAVVCFRERPQSKPGWRMAAVFGVATGYAALLRPDGALVAVALWPALLFVRSENVKKRVSLALVAAVIAIAPFSVWAARNWAVFHVVEPLAPRYANDPGESPHKGWQRWVSTWCLDFISTYQIYWYVPDGELDANQLPDRAFDSHAEREKTLDLIGDYNNVDKANYDLTPEIDARFAALAAERVKAHPLRSYVWLPLGRLADMWLRPRIENLPIDLDWWVYDRHNEETWAAWALAGVNVLYLLLAVAGFVLRTPLWRYMLAYILLRSALLLTVEAPEARYTLECYPMMLLLGGVALEAFWRRLRVRG